MLPGEDAFHRHFATAIERLGRPGFDQALVDAMTSLAECRALLGFLHLPRRMIPLVAGGPGDRADTAMLASVRFSGRLWHSDFSLLAGTAKLPEEEVRIRVDRRQDFGSSPMGGRLLDFLCATAQISAYRRVGQGIHLLRLYTDEAEPETVSRRIGNFGAPLMAALTRHGELKKRSRTPILRRNAQTQIAASLGRLERRLTPREIVVCNGILLGKTVEAISLDLGIKESSVRTYRKRAYRRLGISSQSQLFALCFNDLTAR